MIKEVREVKEVRAKCMMAHNIGENADGFNFLATAGSDNFF